MPDCPYCGEHPYERYCASYYSHIRCCKKSSERSEDHHRQVVNRRDATIAEQREIIARHEEKIDDLTTEVEDLRSQLEERELELATANSTIDQLRRRPRKTTFVPVVYQPTDFLSWPYRKISIANVVPQRPSNAVVPFRTLQNSSHLAPFKPQNHRVI